MTDLITIHLGSRQPKLYLKQHEKPAFPSDLSLEAIRDLLFPKDSETGSRGWIGEGAENEMEALRYVWENKEYLHPKQPDELKCRVKMRLSKNSSLKQSMDEIQRAWYRLDHAEPAWVAGNDEFTVRMVSELFSSIAIRPWQPELNDE